MTHGASRTTTWRRLLAPIFFVLSIGSATMAAEMPSEDGSDVVKELAPSGRLRAAINFGNPVLAQKDSATGEARGVSVDLTYALGRRLGVPVELVAFDAAGKVFDAIASKAWDVAFLAIEPVRSAEINFSPPYVIIEGSYLVPSSSPLRNIEDVDRNGIHIAVGRGSAYDLYLTRTLKHAELVRAATSAAAIDEFQARGLDVLAGVRQPLAAFAKTHPNVRLMAGRFMVIQQAMGTPKGRPAGARYLHRFVEEMKATGFIAEALEKSHQPDVAVAPPAGDP